MSCRPVIAGVVFPYGVLSCTVMASKDFYVNSMRLLVIRIRLHFSATFDMILRSFITYVLIYLLSIYICTTPTLQKCSSYFTLQKQST